MMAKCDQLRVHVTCLRLLTVALVILIDASLQTLLLNHATIVNSDKEKYQGLKKTKQERQELDPSIDPSNDRLSSQATKIPKQIFMFWDTGFQNKTKPEAQLAIRSFEFLNPSWNLYALNTSEAERLTDRSSYIPDSVWDKLKVQAKSDVYRTLLLYRHGGVWADASVYCNMPLDSWIDLDADDLFSFRRFDNMEAQNRTGKYPWITSWFLAAPKEAPILQKLVDVISNSSQAYRFTSRYFW